MHLITRFVIASTFWQPLLTFTALRCVAAHTLSSLLVYLVSIFQWQVNLLELIRVSIHSIRWTLLRLTLMKLRIIRKTDVICSCDYVQDAKERERERPQFHVTWENANIGLTHRFWIFFFPRFIHHATYPVIILSVNHSNPCSITCFVFSFRSLSIIEMLLISASRFLFTKVI